MKTKTNFYVRGLLVVLGTFVFLAFTVPQEQKKGEAWDIPAKYKTLKNPVKDDASLIKVGKMIYSKHCKSCHGSKGKGDGPKAANLDTFPGDFANADFQAQPDGAIYYQSIIGRDDMPNYESKIPDDEDRWALVNYIRTLK